VKSVHLVGFITKKFVTMHGHMNAKLFDFLLDSRMPIFSIARLRKIDSRNWFNFIHCKWNLANRFY